MLVGGFCHSTVRICLADEIDHLEIVHEPLYLLAIHGNPLLVPLVLINFHDVLNSILGQPLP